jgi:LacI family transcriptional regulator
LRESGIEIIPDFILEGDFKPPSGFLTGRRLLESPHRPTAIFAGNDEMAYGVMQAAESLQIRIPEDLALAGFDDIAPSAHVRPPLTTVRQPFYDMGHHAISLLLSLLEASRIRVLPSLHSMRLPDETPSEEEKPPIRLEIPSTLVVRASTAPSELMTTELTG